MPDLSALASTVIDKAKETIPEETVTMVIPEESVAATPASVQREADTDEVKIDTVNNMNTIEKKKVWMGDSCKEALCEHYLVWAKENNVSVSITTTSKDSVVEKIQCNTGNCRMKIFNTVEEFDQHVKDRHIGGRPCGFCENKESVLKKAYEYIDKCYNSKPQQMPFIEELALILDVDEDTIGNWAKKKIGETEELEHPQFFGIYKKLNVMQKLFLQKRTLGRFNPTGAIALLKWHHGMIETSKQILAGSKEQGEELTIKVVEEAPKVTHE